MALALMNSNTMVMEEDAPVDSSRTIVSGTTAAQDTTVSAHIATMPYRGADLAASLISLSQAIVRAQQQCFHVPPELLRQPAPPPARSPPRRNRRTLNIDNNISDAPAPTRKYVCDTCGDNFSYKHVLQNHVRIHTGEKPFHCREPGCNKRFTRDHHLKTHMRLHTGEKPFPCDHCEKRFVQVANLRRHHRTHVKERPFLCNFKGCPDRFPDPNQLWTHQYRHHKQLRKHGQRACSPPPVVTYLPFYQSVVQEEPEDLSLKNRLPIS